jgi:hypothetical protein
MKMASLTQTLAEIRRGAFVEHANELSQQVYAFLRYQVDGKLLIGIELDRPKFVQQAAFEAIGRDIQERTAKPLHYGALST